MADCFHFLEEPHLVFGMGQRAADPRDGLALFGAVDARDGLPSHVVLGTPHGLALWNDWWRAMNEPAACLELARLRAWPPYPGFDVAFGSPWSAPARTYVLNAEELHHAAFRADQHERTYTVANHYLDHMEQVSRLDEKPALAICIVPDDVYRNCRPQAFVTKPSDTRRTPGERRLLRSILDDRASHQVRMFPEHDPYAVDDPTLEQFTLSPDFRRQLKARMMQHELPIQIVKESTLCISDEIRYGLPGQNPLSDRLWNFGTGVFYKLGRKPWRLDTARDGVCYIGLAYKRAPDSQTACCAAQLFLDSGDGLVFVGEFGPWYSKETEQFHLTRSAARELLDGALTTYNAQGGRPLREIFLHARSGINYDEYIGFRQACPQNVNLVGVRVRKDREGPRLFRHDDHPNLSRRGMYPVLRGVLWQRTKRHGLLFTSGFKERIAAYDGWEVPVPLSITLQHGEANLVVVARDILALTKVNYNTCQLGESEPITVKYSDRVGEILLSNRELRRETWQHNFKYYI